MNLSSLTTHVVTTAQGDTQGWRRLFRLNFSGLRQTSTQRTNLSSLVSSNCLLHVCKLLLQASLIGVDRLKSWYFNLTKTSYCWHSRRMGWTLHHNQMTLHIVHDTAQHTELISQTCKLSQHNETCIIRVATLSSQSPMSACYYS